MNSDRFNTDAEGSGYEKFAPSDYVTSKWITTARDQAAEGQMMLFDEDEYTDE